MPVTPIRHAEIAGGGIAGLTAACVLARRGWSVRLHEQSDQLREMGAGIYLKVNSLLVLKEIGALDEVRRVGMRLREGQIHDESNRVLVRRVLQEDEEAIVILRGELQRILAESAIRLGAEVMTDSNVRSADPSGKLLLGSGAELSADLIIGADGYRSLVRESLGLTDSLEWLSDGATRVLAPRLGTEREGVTVEYWSGDCRVGVVPCSEKLLYLYLIGPDDDPRAQALPVDQAFWAARFPRIADIIHRIPADGGRHDRLSLGKVRAWSSGRVAIIGDAAHAQPPNMGQGAGMAMANAAALGALLDESEDVVATLRRWEAQRRPVSDEVQIWSHRYGLLCRGLPARLKWPRAVLVWAIARIGFTSRKWAYLWRGGYDSGEVSTFHP